MKCEVYEIEEILDKCQTKVTVDIQLYNILIKDLEPKKSKKFWPNFLMTFQNILAIIR